MRIWMPIYIDRFQIDKNKDFFLMFSNAFVLVTNRTCEKKLADEAWRQTTVKEDSYEMNTYVSS